MSRRKKTSRSVIGLLLLLIAVALWQIGAALIERWGGDQLTDTLPPPDEVEGVLQVLVLDIGQGDSILVLTPGGYSMLVDGGNSESDALDVIIPTLKEHGFDRLDWMVATHPDQDHIGGLVTVLREFPVRHVLLTGQVHTTQTYEGFLEQIAKLKDAGKLSVVQARRGVEVDLDPAVQVEVLAPGDEMVEKEGETNNASIVMRLTYGKVHVLLTGDAEAEEEMWILDQGSDVRAQILKVSHHGSKSGSTSAFLDAVQPEVALISVGEGNRWGHPDDVVLRRLERRGVKIYRTDRQGTITVTIDGKGYRVETER